MSGLVGEGGDYFPAPALYELAHKAAGIGAGAVMAEHPRAEMPAEVITVAVRRLLEDEYGIEAPEGYR